MMRNRPAILAWAACMTVLPLELALGAEGEGDFVLPTAFWAILSFLLVLFILTKKLFPLILGAMDRRAEEIREALDAAKKARAEAAEMIKAHEASLDEARREAAEIVEEGRRDAERLAASIKDRAHADAGSITERALREIELAKDAAIDELDQRAVRLSLDIASRLIEKNLTEEEHKDLIAERLKDFDFQAS